MREGVPMGELGAVAMHDAAGRRSATLRPLSRLVAVIAIVAAAASLASSCGGSGRSAEAFCSQVHEGTDQLRAAAKRTEAISRKNALLGLIAAFGGYGDFEQFLDRLNKVAPSEIEADMKVIATDFHEAIDTSGKAAGDLLTGSAGGIIQLVFKQLAHQNSYHRVDAYAAAHCGTAIFAPPSSTT